MKQLLNFAIYGFIVDRGFFLTASVTGAGGAVQLITVILLFIIVLALTYFTTRFIGSYQKKQMSGSNIKILETMRLSTNKLIQIVKVGDKCFAVAVCKDTVTLLGELDEECLNVKETAFSHTDSFAAVFNRLRRKDGQYGDKPKADELSIDKLSDGLSDEALSDEPLSSDEFASEELHDGSREDR